MSLSRSLHETHSGSLPSPSQALIHVMWHPLHALHEHLGILYARSEIHGLFSGEDIVVVIASLAPPAGELSCEELGRAPRSGELSAPLPRTWAVGHWRRRSAGRP